MKTISKKYVFGYGSLINCVSASKTLDRKLSREDLVPANLDNFQRSWSLWDDVFSEKLHEKVKGIYLNIIPSQDNYTNGVIIEINDKELKNLSIREKNYHCIDVTNSIKISNEKVFDNFEVFSFIGKDEYLVKGDTLDGYIFENYIKIVDAGISDISKEFHSEFYETTLVSNMPILDGAYSFVDYNQQKKV